MVRTRRASTRSNTDGFSDYWLLSLTGPAGRCPLSGRLRKSCQKICGSTPHHACHERTAKKFAMVEPFMGAIETPARKLALAREGLYTRQRSLLQ